jgi:hypothetical protein
VRLLADPATEAGDLGWHKAMAKKPDTVQERIVRTPPDAPRGEDERPAGAGAMVMRDESDEIIDNLKRQLAALQLELAQVKTGPEEESPAAPARQGRRGGRAKLVEEFNASFAPHLVQRLHVPAEELTQRLARLIEQVSDPELKAELEACRETAYFLSSTFQRIQDNHRLLTESLVAERMESNVTVFLEQVARMLEQRGVARAQIRIAEPSQRGDDRMIASPLAAATVLSTLGDLATGVFGGAARMTLGAGTAGHLRLLVETDRPWRGVAGGEVSGVVFRPGVRAASVVDVLYVEKLIELQGGRLSFYRQSGQALGFEVLWPIEAQ